MKKLSLFLTLAVLICQLAACGKSPSDETESSKPSEQPQSTSESTQTEDDNTQTEDESTQTEEDNTQTEEDNTQTEEESTHTDVLYAVFSSADVREYPIEYTGAKKTAEELADALSELVGLDFSITARETDDGLIVDWAADSTLIAGLDNREQKQEFFFFDNVTLSWFMMDSLCRTLTENLGVENIYYTMKGGEKLVVYELYPVNEFDSDIPYTGSDSYGVNSGVQDEEVGFLDTKGTWKLDGEEDTASIDMDGIGNFIMYYADKSVEASGYLGYTGMGNGELQYDCYTSEGEFIVSFCFDSWTQIHLVNDAGSVYKLDMWPLFQGYWVYPEGQILEITADEWAVYDNTNFVLLAAGTVEYTEDTALLMNNDGSSWGGKISFNDEKCLTNNEQVLTYIGKYFENAPQG
ncbi:MAG: hypothetical protein ACI4XJ_11070 [Eubacteriales bacterium]